MTLFNRLAEGGWLPDSLIRVGIRRRIRARIRSIERETEAEREELIAGTVAEMNRSPPGDAGRADPDAGKYPEELFGLVLGRRRLLSCGFWPAGTANLDAAEEAMLERTCANAGLEDGMDVLDLGCGLGSLALWIAEHYPSTRVLALAEGDARKGVVERLAGERGLGDLEVVTATPEAFEIDARFDRVFALETLAGIRNYAQLLRRVRRWLRPEGRALAQIACHRRWPYPLESGWPGGAGRGAGLMPSDDLLYRFQDDLEVGHHWSFSGEHYQRTAEAWLVNMDGMRREILAAMPDRFSSSSGRLSYHRWRIRLISCAEQFGCHRGQEWWVNHYLLRPRLRA